MQQPCADLKKVASLRRPIRNRRPFLRVCEPSPRQGTGLEVALAVFFYLGTNCRALMGLVGLCTRERERLEAKEPGPGIRLGGKTAQIFSTMWRVNRVREQLSSFNIRH